MMVDIIPLLRQRGLDVDILVFNGEETPFKDQLRKAGVRIMELSRGGSMYNPWYIFRLRKIIRQYDIVHAHNTPAQFFVAIANWLNRKKRVLVTTEHSTNNRRRSMSLFLTIDKWMYRQYRTVICVSQKVSDNIVQYVGDDVAVRTIENGVDVQRYSYAQPYDKRDLLGICDDCIMVLQVAAFRVEKDQETVIKAIALLPKAYHAVFVGDGPTRVHYEELAEQHGVADRVHFLGVRSDVAEILKSADVVVMSSHWEGLSLSSVEGMCVGKPFVASDVQGLHEVVEGAGILFPHQDAQQLAEVLEHLMSDSELYKSVAERCMKRAMNYDISKMVEGYASIYLSEQ